MHPMQQARQAGVRIPDNQSTASAPTMKLTNFTTGEWALVEYGNERGIQETTMVFICGGKVYVPGYPNYQQWTASFRPLAAELSAQVISQLDQANVQAAAAPTVPSQDAVDVFSGAGV